MVLCNSLMAFMKLTDKEINAILSKSQDVRYVIR